MSRTKKSLKNILAGLGFQAITILSNFICRTALIRYLGIDYVSLNGLFWEIVSMLSLVEMGIGSAIVYHLYKPIADGNIELIKKIMGLYRKCYYIIAFVCLCIGSVITVFVPYLVNGLNFSDTYLRSIFFIYVLQTVFSYMWVSDTALLQADQKRYKTVAVQAVYKLVSTVLSLLCLYLTKRFSLYLLILLGTTMFCNITCRHTRFLVLWHLRYSEKAGRVFPVTSHGFLPCFHVPDGRLQDFLCGLHRESGKEIRVFRDTHQLIHECIGKKPAGCPGMADFHSLQDLILYLLFVLRQGAFPFHGKVLAEPEKGRIIQAVCEHGMPVKISMKFRMPFHGYQCT